ncbi:MAG: putative lipid II flippase FtsW [Methylococcaceae bacterium]|nr:putative lipid II flippase FtsW [Methylococcaceae bacterium]
MKKTVSAHLPFQVDNVLLVVCISILLIGFVMVTSASLHLGTKMTGSMNYYPIRQLTHIAIGLLFAGLTLKVPMPSWERLNSSLFMASLLLLVIVFIPGLGVKVNGSVRWLSLGGLRIQVSEITKVCAVIYMAGYITRHHKNIQQSALGICKPLFLFMFASIFLLLEPDLGSAVVLFIIAMGMLFLAGARLHQFSILFLAVIAVVTVLVVFFPYRLQRVTSFINPWADPLKTGFQLTQALISFGRGEWLGVGLGSGVQKLFYLPEAHTDFLFSVIAEELGLLGVVTVISLFAVLIWRAFFIASLAEQAGQKFAAYIAYGLGIWFGFQTFVNIGVNMGILPTKGLTLPLMSYGGGSMIVMCMAVALLFRVYAEAAEVIASTPKGKRQWHSV